MKSDGGNNPPEHPPKRVRGGFDMSVTEWMIIAVTIGFPVWLYLMSDRAKNPVLFAVVGIPLFAVVAGVIFFMLGP